MWDKGSYVKLNVYDFFIEEIRIKKYFFEKKKF